MAMKFRAVNLRRRIGDSRGQIYYERPSRFGSRSTRVRCRRRHRIRTVASHSRLPRCHLPHKRSRRGTSLL